MVTRKKLLIVLLFSFMIPVEKIYSESGLFVPGPLGFPIAYFSKEDIQYTCDLIYKNPGVTLSIAAATGASVYCAYKYWHSNLSTKKQSKSGNRSAKSLEEFQQCNARWYLPGDMTTTFQDVAGMHEAKSEVFDFVDFLSDPQQFADMGAKIPKGVLLAGDPGTGKTLLARAVAGEANVAFCHVNASEFIEAIVGIGASRIRDLFRQAKEAAPCIIFIDEIDTIGHTRQFSGSGGSNESVQTLNQLLAEMDGFETNEVPIVIMAATNRIDVLDPALLRPGRFDKHVNVPMPKIKDRIDILTIHLRKIKHADDISVVRLARATGDFSGADLACLVNDAAILAVRQKADCVTMNHFEEAYDNMLLGRVCKNSMAITDKELWATAVHEAGHALLCVYQKDANALYKVSIEPRGRTLGVTHHLPEIERYNHNSDQMFAQMVVSLGGAVAEELVYGNRGTGAISDLQSVRSLAIDIIAKYGMSDEFRNVTFAIHSWQDLAPEIRDRLESEIHKLITKAEKEATQLLTQHRLELDALVNLLLEKLVVSGEEVYELCGVEKPNIEFSLS